MSAPLVLLHESMAATKLSDLYSRHLRARASTVKRLKIQGATLCFISPLNLHSQSPILDIISDGVMEVKGDAKGRKSFIILHRFKNIVHSIKWSARRPPSRVAQQRHGRNPRSHRQDHHRTVHQRAGHRPTRRSRGGIDYKLDTATSTVDLHQEARGAV